ncbi:hypothetical protein [Methylobacterium dankookense]|uniref:Uncharacterized protein n=1 Tax=Methylobacterium dankookense TaxID=560405 RepID=A0A564G5A5_9HYPH|nr:hypothetical protein [Methylobacterium dankookense]GJD54640.1 hypothetical protein IFDJLNFL_0515 [Methylobacterium dankookense]VUF15689.1 hypothetical protein MTDSW087_05433 [Methylobacterium dankookense]
MPIQTRDPADSAKPEPRKPVRDTPTSLKEAADRCRTTPSGRFDPSPHRTGGSR